MSSPTLTVWRFPTPYGADEGELRLKMLSEHGGIVVHDVASVVWFANARRPRVRQLSHVRGSDELGGAFWGTLLGTVFLMPFAGAAVGAAAGALKRRFHDTGIDDDFVAELREQLTPGTSALFVLSSDGDRDLLRTMFPRREAQLMWTDLEPDAAQRLRDAVEQPSE